MKIIRIAILGLAASMVFCISARAQNQTLVRILTGNLVRELIINHKGQDLLKDTDGDGISDALELQFNTDPMVADTDGDLVPDGIELAHGLDPTKVNPYPEFVYLVTKLPIPTAYSDAEAYDISNTGIVSGAAYWHATTSKDSAVRWNIATGSMETAPTDADSYGWAINDDGAIVGKYKGVALYWRAGGLPRTVGLSDSHTNHSSDINSSGVVVGYLNSQFPEDTGAYAWSDNGAGAADFTHLSAPSGYRFPRAEAINDEGKIVGIAYSITTGKSAGVIWNGATPALMMASTDSGEAALDQSRDINRIGAVLGVKDSKPAVWTPTEGRRFLPMEANASISAWKMNAFGEIIGTLNYSEPTLWRPDGAGGWEAVSINPEILDDEVALSFWPNSINDAGQIVGSYYDGSDNKLHPVVLTPILRPQLAVDANRDGQIKLPSEDASDATTAERPYRFWVNDDIDRFHSFEDGAPETMDDVIESEEDDIGPEEAAKWNTDHPNDLWKADWEDGKIMSERDLEDFARLHFDLGALHESLKRGDFYLGLKFKRVVAGDPKIQLYPAADMTGGLKHLTQDGTAALQLYDPSYAFGEAILSRDVERVVSKDELFVFSLLHWHGEHERWPFIFEGASTGQGELALVLVAANGTTEMGELASIHMVLEPITEMYEHMTVGNNNGGPPSALSEIHALPIPTDPEEKKYVLFVHGWNMERWEKERFAETVFKRLWWQGYRGRFGLFSWPTTNKFKGTPFKGLTDGTHFDRGEWTAWRSGVGLRELLAARYAAYDGEVYVLSHSMGGVVTGEALRLQSDSTEGRIAKVYVASQAALSAHLYDGGIDSSGSAGLQWTYAHPKFDPLHPQSYGPDTANIYPFWFGRFMNGGGDSHSSVAKVVNFYNGNDWALAAPAWHFNQITKPDYPDFLHDQPFLYNYDALLEGFGRINVANDRIMLNVGARGNPVDRYEIMAFAAESRVKSFGALEVIGPEVTESVNVRLYWPSDAGAHKAHRWHSAQFRSTIVKQHKYWEALLSPSGFAIESILLP